LEQEMLKIFDENRNEIGVAPRDEVHKFGYWHETFHCWFVLSEGGVDYLYFQLRSEIKKDYPNLLDITAAGHLLAHETILDGIREVKEELGIAVSFDSLISLGIIKYCVEMENFIDKELASAFLYHSKHTFDEYELQVEEVSGIVRAEFNSFYELWFGNRHEIMIEGFEINQDGSRASVKRNVSKSCFVPHEDDYYEQILISIRNNIRNGVNN
jgi:isopentenyldiphosphate isomerase